MLNANTRAELQFELKEDIGAEGRNSDVFVAHDKQLDTELVVKRIRKNQINQDQLEEFYAEAKLLHLGSHPNVVPIHYACEDAEYVYMALPYYRAGSLKKVMNQQFLTTREIVRYACNFLSGLHHIHTKGLLHFDIKPDNILLSHRNEGLLSDFGLAVLTNAHGLAQQKKFYVKMLPPERFQDREFSSAFDIYQAGLTLYRMANGDRNFDQQFEPFVIDESFNSELFIAAVCEGRFPDRNAFLEHIPQRLRNVIKKCLEVNPDRRYKSVLHIVNDLSDIDGAELDWRYEENQNCRQWFKENKSGVNYRCVIENMDLHAVKVSSTGAERRIIPYCKERATRADIQKFLRSH
ncbi:serine/threonine-protein kinase [Marinobacter sp. LV10MA510-1]|uniref:serine/threonine-protein kinase n=1 Tax=Marinobacter sp. LV10MA510-1 TaxID=1415567 RepID=UPI000BF8DCD7|nr:serine/threonine-protein kinase [Marinobacter sp. LV10MA510-1]PFG11404.1 serine/threonine protein kinase [Marinobacter sp. LV10MA510-1]